MKRLNNLIATAALCLAGVASASAYEVQTIENYKFDFDDPIACGFTEADASGATYESREHTDFAPTGWGHAVDVHGTGYSMKPVYTWASSGVGSTGTIRVGEQEGTDYSTYESFSYNDMLVTPKVSGTITLDIRSYYSASIKFYKMTQEGGQWVKGDEIAVDVPSYISSSDFTTINFELAEAAYVGIRGNNIYLDNFTASKAELEMRPGLSLSVAPQTAEFNDADAEGNVKLNYQVTVKNTGLVDLAEGAEGYSLELLEGKDGDVIATLPLTAALPKGEQATVDFDATIKAADYADGFDAYIRENVSGKSVFAATVNPVPYKAIFAITDSATKAALPEKYDLGIAQHDLVATFVIANNGAAPMTISNYTLPEGYTTDAEAKTFAAHESQTIHVTLSASKAGEQAGDFVITGEGVDFKVALTGVIAEQGKMFYDFEDCDASYYKSTIFPVGLMAGASWQISSRAADMKRPGNKLNAYQYSTTQTNLVTPLVEVKDGDVLSFEGAKGSDNAVLEVYYSADRKEWTKVYTVGGENITDRDAAFDNENRNPDEGMYASVYYGFDKYTVSNIPAGKWYIAFGGSYVYLDNIYGFTPVDVDHDLAVTDQNLAETGMVNYATKNEVTLYNANTKAEAAGSYTAEFFIDDEKVAEAEAVELAPSASTTFSFEATPHKAGELSAYAVFTFGDYVVKTDAVTLTVAEETFSPLVQVGVSSGKTTSGLLDMEKKESQGAVLYTAEKLGLSAGTKIISLTLKGMAQQSTWSAVTSLDLKFWVANSELTELPAIDENFNLTSVIDTTANKVYDGAYEPFGTVGAYTGYSSPYTLTEVGDLITINFAEPFEYTGKSIVVAARHKADNSYYYFGLEGDADAKTAVISTLGYGDWTAWNGSSWSGAYNPNPAPVIYFGTEAEAPAVNGKVTGARNASIADASVVLTSDNVQYATTTDADGNFSLNVLQPNREYTLTVTADGYEDYVQTIDLSTVELPLSIKLTKSTGTGIENVNTMAVRRAKVYTLDGQLVGYDVDPKTLKSGLYIIDNKKVLVK